jgi:hypothetical protein
VTDIDRRRVAQLLADGDAATTTTERGRALDLTTTVPSWPGGPVLCPKGVPSMTRPH